MKKVLLLLLLLFTLNYAQNSYYSPYGLGLASKPQSIRMQGLGNSGTAISDSISLNSDNPAFWCNFITTSLQGTINFSSLDGEKTEDSPSFSNFSGFSMKFPVGKYMGFAMGLQPITRARGKQFRSDSVYYDNSYINYTNDVELIGGISEGFFGFGYKIGTYLSVGVKSKILFGQYLYQNITDLDADGFHNTITKKKMSIHGNQIGIGLGWNDPKRFSLSIYYNHPISFNYQTDYDYSVGPDSTNSESSSKLPASLQIGFYKKLPARLAISADFHYINKQENLFNEFNVYETGSCGESVYYGFGLERRPSRDYNRNFLNKFVYRIGAFSKTEPYYQNSSRIKEFGITGGIGIPFNMYMSRMDLAVQYSQRSGFLDKSVGKENIISLNIGITTGGLWFVKYIK